jgi:hypothetical protein
VSESSTSPITARCACGNVEFAATGAPIVCAVCYCDDCQEGARQLEALPNAPPFADPDGGTPMLAYRRDRVKCTKGAALLRAHKLKPDSATNRIVATCCNSVMVLSFDDAKWWTDLYRTRVLGDPPPLDMRNCTKFRRAGSALPDDVPNYPRYPLRLFAKLLAARIGMLLYR